MPILPKCCSSAHTKPFSAAETVMNRFSVPFQSKLSIYQERLGLTAHLRIACTFFAFQSKVINQFAFNSKSKPAHFLSHGRPLHFLAIWGCKIDFELQHYHQLIEIWRRVLTEKRWQLFFVSKFGLGALIGRRIE